MKRRLLAAFASVFLILSLLSCASSDTTLEKGGEEVIALMCEMTASEEYEKMYGLPADYSDAVTKLRAGDYSKIKAVYELDIPESFLSDGADISGELGEYVTSAVYLSLASRINQKSGVKPLSVAAAYSAQICFVNTSLNENTVYLYVFENGYPIMVTFMPGKDGAVRAVGYFILSEAFEACSAEEIESCLALLGIGGVKAIKK